MESNQQSTDKSGAAQQPEEAKSARDTGAAAARAERIDWLFRYALRQQQLHPLMALVRRYRDLPTHG